LEIGSGAYSRRSRVPNDVFVFRQFHFRQFHSPSGRADHLDAVLPNALRDHEKIMGDIHWEIGKGLGRGVDARIEILGCGHTLLSLRTRPPRPVQPEHTR
jgi:hypothetical protein